MADQSPMAPAGAGYFFVTIMAAVALVAFGYFAWVVDMAIMAPAG
jgi:hypothetical protein